jgi:cation diffusion facilitator CzcD-associated flavoprotein CzcO
VSEHFRKLLRRRGRDLFGPTGTPSICVIGGGMGGIAAGVKLAKAGIRSFTIFEKSSGIGGTWWDNRYPGAECDVASYLYSYGFISYDWSRSHARQDEIQSYLEHVVDTFGLRPHFRFGVAVDEAVWNDDDHRYTVTLANGERQQFDVVVSAVGLLNEPNIPTWPGRETFSGVAFHTARWESDHDLTGKRVGVVGTGSTSVQVVAEIAPLVEKLLVFQREPGWILPKNAVDYSEEQRAKLRRRSRRLLARATLRYANEKGLRRGAVFHPESALSKAGEQAGRAFIEREFADRPDLREAVTPAYPYPGKRPVSHGTFYATLKRDNVSLIPRAVTAFSKNGVIDSDGREHVLDVLVMATGFHAAQFLPRLSVRGKNGRSLHEVWAGEPFAFLGITVPGFPNFFMLYGPNTNGGEIVFVLERGAEHVVRAVKTMMRRGATAVEVRASWCDRYNRWLQAKMQGTSWTRSRNYFTSASGRVVTQWPFGALFYGLLVNTIGRVSQTTRRRR